MWTQAAFAYIGRILRDITSRHRTDNLYKFQQTCSGIVATDHRWQHRRQAKLGTTVIYDIQQKKVIGLQTTTKSEAKTSQGMDGWGTTIAFKNLYHRGVPIKVVVHDKCASTMPRIRVFYPNAEEALDTGHRAQNLQKKIIAMGKSEKAFRGLGAKLKRHFITTVYGKTSIEAKQHFLNSVEHYGGNHEKCSESCPKTGEARLNKAQKELLKTELEKFSNDLHLANRAFNTCSVESFNNSLTTWIDKQLKCNKESYEM